MLFALLLATCDPATVERKISYLHDTLATEKHQMQIWSWTFGSLYAATTTAQAVALPFVSSQTRGPLSVGVGAAAFGALTLTLLPLRVTLPIGALDQRWQDPDRCGVLRDAELALAQAAEAEAQASSWIAHMGNVLLNMGLMLVIGIAMHQWDSAFISGSIGIVVGEVNLITQPSHLPGALRDYQRF